MPDGRNKRTVWTVATQPYAAAHFATFPEALIEPCILAGTSERGQCPACGAPWRRVVERETVPLQNTYNGAIMHDGIVPNGKRWGGSGVPSRIDTTTTGWQPTCTCDAGDPIPQTVLDPFAGSGTTGVVALRHGRSFVGVEINPTYCELARNRIRNDAPLFNRVEVSA
jgi:hypothetical protein